MLGRQALTFGCLFALDSDAHTTAQLSYAETARAHARLAGIPVDRIVNCWPLDRLLAWIRSQSAVVERAARGAYVQTKILAAAHQRSVRNVTD
jgi:hypothetical protein